MSKTVRADRALFILLKLLFAALRQLFARHSSACQPLLSGNILKSVLLNAGGQCLDVQSWQRWVGRYFNKTRSRHLLHIILNELSSRQPTGSHLRVWSDSPLSIGRCSMIRRFRPRPLAFSFFLIRLHAQPPRPIRNCSPRARHLTVRIERHAPTQDWTQASTTRPGNSVADAEISECLLWPMAAASNIRLPPIPKRAHAVSVELEKSPLTSSPFPLTPKPPSLGASLVFRQSSVKLNNAVLDGLNLNLCSNLLVRKMSRPDQECRASRRER